MAQSVQLIISFYDAYSYLENQLLWDDPEPEYISGILQLVTHSILRTAQQWAEDNSLAEAHDTLTMRPRITPELASMWLRAVDTMVAQVILTHIPDFGGKGYQGIVNYEFINLYDVRITITPPASSAGHPGN